MTAQEIDRIECAIRHIQSSLDVDPWARDIAVNAMEKQIPKEVIPNVGIIKPALVENANAYVCPVCFSWTGSLGYCSNCGQKICWEDE